MPPLPATCIALQSDSLLPFSTDKRKDTLGLTQSCATFCTEQKDGRQVCQTRGDRRVEPGVHTAAVHFELLSCVIDPEGEDAGDRVSFPTVGKTQLLFLSLLLLCLAAYLYFASQFCAH